MTPEQQRIAIAEACGLFRLAPLKRTNRNGKDNPLGVRLWYCVNDHGGAKEYAYLPDYLNDLNAMHEAEEVLDCNQWEQWHRIVGEWPTDVARITAKQRAEAFLKTLGLWKETK